MTEWKKQRAELRGEAEVNEPYKLGDGQNISLTRTASEWMLTMVLRQGPHGPKCARC